MKKYKRTRIVASLAVISSLAFSSTTFGATMPISFRDRVREPTFNSTSRSMRLGAEFSTSTGQCETTAALEEPVPRDGRATPPTPAR